MVLDPDAWLVLTDAGHDGNLHDNYRRTELLAAIRTLIATALTPHQREVLVALTIQEIPIDILAERLDSTRGAIYKTLHDARRKFRAELSAAGHDLEAIIG